MPWKSWQIMEWMSSFYDFDLKSFSIIVTLLTFMDDRLHDLELVLSVIIHIRWILNSINIRIWKLGNIKKPRQIKLAKSFIKNPKLGWHFWKWLNPLSISTWFLKHRVSLDFFFQFGNIKIKKSKNQFDFEIDYCRLHRQ